MTKVKASSCQGVMSVDIELDNADQYFFPSFTNVISNGVPQKGPMTLTLLQYLFKGSDLTAFKFRLYIAERKTLFMFQHFM